MKPFSLEWWIVQQHKIIIELIEANINYREASTWWSEDCDLVMKPRKKEVDRLSVMLGFVSNRIIDKYGE